MLTFLPPHSTSASLARLELARQLVETCPPDLGAEIALTGSAARGVADGYSDIELNFWGAEIPDAEARGGWLSDAGADSFDVRPQWVDGSSWITCRMRDVWIEAGWSTVPEYQKRLGRILSGKTASYPLLVLGSVIQDAVPLRTEGILAGWKEEVSHYPEGLHELIIRENTGAWSDPHTPPVRWALAHRRDHFALAQRLTWDIMNLVRILLALNRQWDRDWKWIDERFLHLPIGPDRLGDRLRTSFDLSDPPRAIRTAFYLIEETLLLVPPSIDVSAALASIRVGMDPPEPVLECL